MNYTITNDLFVVNADNVIISGPYKNDESAKRRIRVLKQRDAEAAVNAVLTSQRETGDLIADGDIETSYVSATIATDPQARDEREMEAEMNSDMLIPSAINAAYEAARRADMTKGERVSLLIPGAASSAYGSVGRALIDAVAKRTSHSPYGTTPAGVYPAISKNERRKRWNYA
jgi:hypothetical protein